MAPRLRLSKRQQQGSALVSGNATLTIPEVTDTTALQTDPSHSGTGFGLATPSLTITPTTHLLPPPTSKVSSNDQDSGLTIPVIIGLSVGIFVFLAIVLVAVMCLLGRRKLRKEKRSWKSLDNPEKADHAPRHVSSFMGLRMSIPDPTIPNPFTSNSPTSDRRVPLNSVSDNTLNKNPGVFVGGTTKLYTRGVHLVEMDTRAPPLTLETSQSVFKTNRDLVAALQAKAPSPKAKHPRHNSAASTYLNLSDEEESPKQADLNTKLPGIPLPAVLSRPSGVGIGLPSNPRASHKPSLLRNNSSFSPSPTVTVASSRPAMAALITALDAVPLEDVAVPTSASSYATNFTALATPRASMRMSMVERPVTLTLDPLGEYSEEVAVVPQANANPNTKMSMEAARPETLTIDPDIKGRNSPIAKSGDSIGSTLSNASQVQTGLETPTLLRLGWASASEYGYEGMDARGSTLTFASSEFDPTRDSLDVRRRGSEDSRK